MTSFIMFIFICELSMGVKCYSVNVGARGQLSGAGSLLLLRGLLGAELGATGLVATEPSSVQK